jgi:glycosyltransferase involved in cell wall biosynthesis
VLKRRSVWPRVLVVRPDLPEGQDNRAWNECHTLVAAGYEVAVVGPPAQVLLHGLRYYPRRHRSGPLAATRTCAVSWLLCLRVLLEHGFSVLQWSGPPHGLWALAAPYRLLGKKLVYDQRDAGADSGDVRSWRRAMERAGVRVAHRVIVSTPAPPARTRRLRAVQPVPTGPRPLLVPLEPEPALRHDRPHLCCCIDPVEGRRGADVLLHAWAVLVHTLGRKDVRLAVLTSPATVRRLQPLMDQLDLQPHVDLVPRTDLLTVSRYLATAQLAVCADVYGPLPDAVLSGAVESAMAARLPHAAFDLPELRNITQTTALYARPGDVVALARCVLDLVDDRALREAMGEEAELRVRTLLQWRVGAPDYIRTFDELLGIPEYGPVVVLPRPGAVGGAPRYVVRPDPRRAPRRQAQRRQRTGQPPLPERRDAPTRRRADRRAYAVATAGSSLPGPRRSFDSHVDPAQDEGHG